MDLQLRNSIYQCNPRCSIEKRNTKTHSTASAAAAASPITPATAAAAAVAVASSAPGRDRATRPTDYTSSLLDKFERDRTDKHELHRNNCLNETVSESISVDLLFSAFSYSLFTHYSNGLVCFSFFI